MLIISYEKPRNEVNMPEQTNYVAITVTIRPDQIEALTDYGQRQQTSPFENINFSRTLREVVDIGLIAVNLVPPPPEQVPA